MDVLVKNGIVLRGSIAAPPSKSEAIRAAILLALCGEDPAKALIGYESAGVCDDVRFAIEACRGLMRGGERLCVGSSAALLRILLPVSLALYGEARFRADPRLGERGLAEYEACFGAPIKSENGEIDVEKRLCPGRFYIDCARSSQFLSGLLLALPLLPGDSEIVLQGSPVSSNYADMTLAYATLFGAEYGVSRIEGEGVIPVQSSALSVPEPPYMLYGKPAFASGDHSYAAFFRAADIMGGSVRVTGLSNDSLQPDKGFCGLVGKAGVDISGMPDLVPPLAAAACDGGYDVILRGTARLAYKESSRANATARLINDLGGFAEAGEDELLIRGGVPLAGGECSSFGDHRIAMTAAILAGACRGPVLLHGAEHTAKSAPDFWMDLNKLGGEYELIRQ